MADERKFGVGDRVRDRAGEEWIVTTNPLRDIGLRGETHVVLGVAGRWDRDDEGPRRDCVWAEELELVEVAHYAPPDVPMIAMTPERIAVLANATVDAERFAEAADRKVLHENAAVLGAMLREARGECAS